MVRAAGRLFDGMEKPAVREYIAEKRLRQCGLQIGLLTFQVDDENQIGVSFPCKLSGHHDGTAAILWNYGRPCAESLNSVSKSCSSEAGRRRHQAVILINNLVMVLVKDWADGLMTQKGRIIC